MAYIALLATALYKTLRDYRSCTRWKSTPYVCQVVIATPSQIAGELSLTENEVISNYRCLPEIL